MKKYIYFTLLFFAIITCKAQSPVYDISEPHEGPQNSYYKDLNGNLDGYDGIYRYTDANIVFKIALKKKVTSYGYYYQDLVVGEFQFIKNGVELNNTLSNIDANYEDEELNHVITGHLILTGTMWGCPDCSPTEKRLRLSFVDNKSDNIASLDIRKTTVNGVPAIKVSVSSGGDIRDKIIGDPVTTPLPPTMELGDYLMTRVFDNKYLLKDFFKNDCPPEGQGIRESYEVMAGKYSSTVSQKDADQKALDEVDKNGQDYANAKALCFFKSKALVNAVFRRKYCLDKIGAIYYYSAPAGAFTSTISQADADAKAQNAGQADANLKGDCVFGSKALVNVGFKKQCTLFKTGSIVYYSAEAGAFTSTVSQADADAKAQAAGQANANVKGTCN